MPKPTTVRLELGQSYELDAIAALTDRPRNWHIEQAVKRYVAAEKQFLDAVEEGIQEARAGDVRPHSEVVAERQRRRAERRVH